MILKEIFEDKKLKELRIKDSNIHSSDRNRVDKKVYVIFIDSICVISWVCSEAS